MIESEAESWEELNIDEWPALAGVPAKTSNPLSPSSQQQLKSIDSVVSDSGLRFVHPFFESQPVMKILPRKKPGDEAGMSRSASTGDLFTDGDGSVASKHKSLEQREREYAEARRRILGDDEASPDSGDGSKPLGGQPKASLVPIDQQRVRGNLTTSAVDCRQQSSPYQRNNAELKHYGKRGGSNLLVIDEAYRRGTPLLPMSEGGGGLLFGPPPPIPMLPTVLDLNRTSQDMSEPLRMNGYEQHHAWVTGYDFSSGGYMTPMTPLIPTAYATNSGYATVWTQHGYQQQ